MIRYAMLLILCTSAAAATDEVFLADGSRVAGTIEKIGGGTLTLATDFAGTISIDTAKVTGIRTDQPLNVKLDSGDVLVGRLEYDPAQGQRIQGDAIGAAAITPAQVSSAWAVGTEDPEIVAARPKWSGRIDFGLDGQSGNTERIGAGGRGELRWTTPRERFLLFSEGRFARENGEDTAREIIGGAKLEVDLTDRLFVWGGTQFEHDLFEEIDFRATATGGLGYFVFREAKTELKLRGGLGYEYTDFTDGSSDDRAIAEAGLDFRYDLAPWLRFVHATTAYPSLEDIDDYRLVIENRGEIPLTPDASWSLRLGVRNQYDSQPNDDVERLDTYYFARIGLDF